VPILCMDIITPLNLMVNIYIVFAALISNFGKWGVLYNDVRDFSKPHEQKQDYGTSLTGPNLAIIIFLEEGYL